MSPGQSTSRYSQLVPTADDRKFRPLFDTVAEVYDRARPGYPPGVFKSLTKLAGVGPGTRTLEIGCGTGQATMPLLELGCHLTAIDLGPRLIEIARRKLAPFPHVEFVIADFEKWSVSHDEKFDLVISATAFHWLNPDTRIDRTADLLRPGGWLATISTYHILGGTRRFFADVQSCYEAHDPSTPPNLRLPRAHQIPVDRDLDHAPRFDRPHFRRYEWDATYTTAQYLDLIRTYSPTLALPEQARTALLDCIGALISTKYHGSITKRYLTELTLARRGDA